MSSASCGHRVGGHRRRRNRIGWISATAGWRRGKERTTPRPASRSPSRAAAASRKRAGKVWIDVAEGRHLDDQHPHGDDRREIVEIEPERSPRRRGPSRSLAPCPVATWTARRPRRQPRPDVAELVADEDRAGQVEIEAGRRRGSCPAPACASRSLRPPPANDRRRTRRRG